MAQMRTERDKANDGQHMLQQKLMNVKQQLQEAMEYVNDVNKELGREPMYDV